MELLNFLWNIVTFRNLRFKDELFYRKISLKCIKELNVKPDMIKLLEENIGRTLSDINQSNIFFDPYARIMKIKAKINKCDLLKAFAQQRKQ